MSDERAFLAAYDPTAFDRPSVAVDVVVIGIDRDRLIALVVRRTEHPFLGERALPGGVLRSDESLDAAAERVLREKAGFANVFLEQLYTFGAIDRDPRTRVVAVAYYALVDGARLVRAASEHGASVAIIEAASDGSIALVDDARLALPLAFDHIAIVETAVRRIRGKVDYAPIGYELLPEQFTLLQLQRVHEIVAGRTFNKDSFRRRMLATGLLVPTRTLQSDVGHRPASLYRYAQPRT